MLGQAILYGALIAVGISFALPLAWMLSTSLKRSAEVFVMPIRWWPAQPQWRNYVEVFAGDVPFHLFLRNTAQVAVLATLGDITSAMVVGYSLARLRWPGRQLVFGLLLATMMLPGVVLMIPSFVLFNRLHWLDTYKPLIVPSWCGGAFHIFLVRQYMLGLPIEYDEAARMDGANSLWILWKVIAPLSIPVISAVAIFSFLYHYNNYTGALLYLTTSSKFTLALGLQWFAGQYGRFWHLVMAGATVGLLPVVILFAVAQRYFLQGIQMSGLAGR
jgi:ABC-type glycerol-3-phosphate transport system permease component